MTVRIVEPEMEPEVALTVVVPAVSEVARPALTVATAGALEDQVAVLVRF